MIRLAGRTPCHEAFGCSVAEHRVIGHLEVRLVYVRRLGVVLAAARVLVLAGERNLICPLTSVTKVEVARGHRSHAGRGVGIGGLIGAGLGVYLGLKAGSDTCSGAFCFKDREKAAHLALGLGMVGAGIGALVGSQMKTYMWEEVSLSRLDVTPLVTPGGRYGIMTSVRF